MPKVTQRVGAALQVGPGSLQPRGRLAAELSCWSRALPVQVLSANNGTGAGPGCPSHARERSRWGSLTLPKPSPAELRWHSPCSQLLFCEHRSGFNIKQTRFQIPALLHPYCAIPSTILNIPDPLFSHLKNGQFGLESFKDPTSSEVLVL